MAKRIVLREWQTSEGFALSEFNSADIDAIQCLANETGWFEVIFKPGYLYLRALSYVGQCQITLPSFGIIELYIHPKVPIQSLMAWWCYAQRVNPLSDSQLPLESVTDIIDQLALWLCYLIRRNIQRGLRSAYINHQTSLSTVRGRLLLKPTIQGLNQGRPVIECRYQERSTDIVDNQILLWTFHHLKQQKLRFPQVREAVNQQYRVLQGAASLVSFSPKQCFEQLYSRDNQHYRFLHTLCGMILSQLTLNEQQGGQTFPTFMLPMNKIFEDAVVYGLRAMIDNRYVVKKQYPYTLSTTPLCRFAMDIVIQDKLSGEAVWVLDTKYKDGNQPSPSDIQQVIAYAATLNTNKATLLYPESLDTPLSTSIHSLRITTESISMSLPPKEAISSFLDKYPDIQKDLSKCLSSKFSNVTMSTR